VLETDRNMQFNNMVWHKNRRVRSQSDRVAL